MPFSSHLSEYLSLIIQPVTTGPFQENSYLVGLEQSNECIIIDPGDEPNILQKEIDSFGKLLAIVCTHAHLDHIGAVYDLKKIYDCPVYLHENDKSVLDSYEESCSFFGLNPKPKPDIDEWITSDNDLIFNDLPLKVLHSPGHTPGSTCFEIMGHLFSGDTLFAGSVGRTDLPGGDWDELNMSLIKIMKTFSQETVVHSGHAPETTIKLEMQQNPFLIPILSHVDS